VTFDEWSRAHPAAAADLARVFEAPPIVPTSDTLSEAWAQQHARMDIARQGAAAWRNNVGALLDSRGVPVRYGLCNDSAVLNEKMKSSDLILCIPRVITREHVGTTIAQFGSVETKRPGWTYTATPRERAQLAWMTLIRRLGGFAQFSTGKVEL
jgi:hypothetical protein